MLTVGEVLTARLAAQIAIAWLDDRPSESAEEEIEKMEGLIRKLDDVLQEVAPGVHDDEENGQEMVALVIPQRSIH